MDGRDRPTSPSLRFRRGRTNVNFHTLTVGTFIALGQGACTPSTAYQSPPAKVEIVNAPPKTPGHSIAETQMCSCTSCEPASCCVGPESGATPRCDSYDFSDCAMAVSSCASRCFEHTWRVGADASCAATRPTACCERPGET